MTPRSLLAAGAALLLAGCATTRPIADPDTRAWWQTTRYLASDAMEGRDTGSPAYERAAAYVADRFRRAASSPPATTAPISSASA
jgi:outer membrane biogenesis lipoprotein LolB